MLRWNPKAATSIHWNGNTTNNRTRPLPAGEKEAAQYIFVFLAVRVFGAMMTFFCFILMLEEIRMAT